MKKYFYFLLSFLCLFITACSPFKPTDERAAVCNELNSKMIFNGNTSNIRKSEIQSSEDMLVQKQYEKANCN